MKNKLLFPIIFAFIFSSCSDFSGNEDAVEASLKPSSTPPSEEEEEEDTPTTRTYYDLDAIAFGNNTFVGVSDSTYLTKSTDNGANWVQGCSGVRVYDVAFGNSKFVASGSVGAIIYSDNGSGCSTGNSGTNTHTLYGITFGNNRFFSVGSSGKLIISADNGATFADKTSPTTITLYSTVFGNSKFVAVGPKAVVVSDNVGGSALKTADNVSFNDVTFGNGVFVGVGDDENIYTSTNDGDTWTKVYGKD